MKDLRPVFPETIIERQISADGFFPNNPYYPLLIYKKPLNLKNHSAWDVKHLFKINRWHRSWTDTIYDYHHYHSNTHEALIILSGNCDVQIGGPDGEVLKIKAGDVIIFPAGVSHKRVEASDHFKCVGAYPYDVEYDMNYGKASEHPKVDHRIKKVPLPQTDPIFGEKGPLFRYWK